MGVFDTMYGYVSCPDCLQLNCADIQFKWGDPMMAHYTIGNYIDGYDPFTIFDSDDNHICVHCDIHFSVYAIGKQGYLYGFANSKQLEELKKVIPLDNDDQSQFKQISLAIDKETFQHPELVAQEFIRLLKEKPDETVFVIDINSHFDENTIDQLLCRVSGLRKQEEEIPKIGDSVWYNNSGIYSPWEYADIEFIIKKSKFDEKSQLHYFTIENKEHNIIVENVYEQHLLNKEKAEEKRQSIKKLENDIISFVHKILNDELTEKQKKLKSFSTLRYKIHAKDIVEKLKEEGKIPLDFEF